MSILKIGDKISAKVVVPNSNGSIDFENVVVTLTIPNGFSIDSSVVSVGSLNANVWTISTVAAKTNATLDLVLNADVQCPLEDELVVNVTGDRDTNTTNNTSTLVLDFITCCDVSNCPGLGGGGNSDTFYTNDGSINTNRQVTVLGNNESRSLTFLVNDANTIEPFTLNLHANADDTDESTRIRLFAGNDYNSAAHKISIDSQVINSESDFQQRFVTSGRGFIRRNLVNDGATSNTLEKVITPQGEVTYSSTNPAWQGLKYATDVSANYTTRSLVDKGYVDAGRGLNGLSMVIENFDFTTQESSFTMTTPNFSQAGLLFINYNGNVLFTDDYSVAGNVITLVGFTTNNGDKIAVHFLT